MLKRNLIYTAITRAKKKVILIGEKRALMAGIHKNDSSKRNTLLSERIKKYIEVEKENVSWDFVSAILGNTVGEMLLSLMENTIK